MRRPTSLLAGLMWFDPDRPDALARIRHNAQERDGALYTAFLSPAVADPDAGDAGQIQVYASSRLWDSCGNILLEMSVGASRVYIGFRYAGLERYGWVRHDGASFGRQEIVDGSVTLTTSLVGLCCSMTEQPSDILSSCI
jgi:hypothetical protein